MVLVFLLQIFSNSNSQFSVNRLIQTGFTENRMVWTVFSNHIKAKIGRARDRAPPARATRPHRGFLTPYSIRAVNFSRTRVRAVNYATGISLASVD
jgi:hypothetical protein